MASKKKSDGSNTVRFVLTAAKRLNTTVTALFRMALPDEPSKSIEQHVFSFQRLLGATLDSVPPNRYEIPPEIIALAASVHEADRPVRLLRKDREPAHRRMKRC